MFFLGGYGVSPPSLDHSQGGGVLHPLVAGSFADHPPIA
nr:MAG TPA: hypothetical protein [Caudoviricetes sp.]